MFMRNLRASQKSLGENGIMTLGGTDVPVDGSSGTGVSIAGPGSLYIRTNGQIYINTNTLASPTWTLLPNGAANSVTAAMLATNTLQVASGTITSANIVGVGAGQLGHANGVELVAAGGAHVVNELVSAMLINDFSVAAYTGGGNTSINIGSGGAALTGVATAAQFITLAADGVIEFVSLAAVFKAYTENRGLNLVSAAAPTQPGTAAGIFRYIVHYRQIATGL